MTPPLTKLPPRVSELISPGRKLPVDVGSQRKLTANQLDALRSVVNRQVIAKTPISMIHAVTALAAFDPSEDTAGNLADLVVNEWEAQPDRATAAIALRRIPAEASEPALIRALSVSEPVLLQRVVQSLGAVAGPGALPKLEKLATDGPAALTQQIAFAKELIASRAGIDVEYRPDVRGVARKPGKDDAVLPMTMRKLRKSTVEKQLSRVVDTRYGIEIGSWAFNVTAGNARWTLFMNEQLQEAGGFGALFERPWLVGILPRWDHQTDTAAVQHVIVSRPNGRTASVRVIRTDGEVVYTGPVKRVRDLMKFSIRDVARRGTAPTNVHGRLTPTGLEIEMASPFAMRKNAGVGESLRSSG